MLENIKNYKTLILLILNLGIIVLVKILLTTLDEESLTSVKTYLMLVRNLSLLIIVTIFFSNVCLWTCGDDCHYVDGTTYNKGQTKLNNIASVSIIIISLIIAVLSSFVIWNVKNKSIYVWGLSGLGLGSFAINVVVVWLAITSTKDPVKVETIEGEAEDFQTKFSSPSGKHIRQSMKAQQTPKNLSANYKQIL